MVWVGDYEGETEIFLNKYIEHSDSEIFNDWIAKNIDKSSKKL